VKLNVHEIEADAKHLAYDEPTAELNSLLERGSAHDFDFPAPMHVTLAYYRSGQELFFSGTLSGPAVGHCARCLDDFVVDMWRDFSFVLIPSASTATEAEENEGDLSLSFYHGDVVDLSPLLREQILLALPTRALCKESCKGLCPQCGANLNITSCNCSAETGDSRLAALRGLKASR